MRRKESLTKKPNDGHLAIAQLEPTYTNNQTKVKLVDS
jgi:hypothetical protein